MAGPFPPSRPSLPVRAAAGAWHVPAGFGFLLRRPGLWPFAVLPVLLAIALVGAGSLAGFFLVPWVVDRFAPAPLSVPAWVEVSINVLVFVVTVGSGAFLGLGLALALTSPALDVLSAHVEARARGRTGAGGRGTAWEALQALRGSLYFLVAAPGVFLLGLVPIIGPLLSVGWGGWAVAFQMTDSALSRRGLSFAEKRRWHRAWRAESLGFGLAGMVGLLVPFANLLLAPALVTGGTLLVLDLEDLEAERRPATPDDEIAGP
jgi:CysZ protein